VLLDSRVRTEKDLNGTNLSDAKRIRALIQHLVASAPKNQALVPVEELPGFLRTGWTFVGGIGSDRVLRTSSESVPSPLISYPSL
jgi:hypothetical protein